MTITKSNYGEISEFKMPVDPEIESKILSFICKEHEYVLIPGLTVKKKSGKVDWKDTNKNINKYLQENTGSAYLWQENNSSAKNAFLVWQGKEDVEDLRLLKKRLKSHVSQKHRHSDITRLLAACINIKFKSFVYDSYDHHGSASAATIQILNSENRTTKAGNDYTAVEYSSIKIKPLVDDNFLSISLTPTLKLKKWDSTSLNQSAVVIDSKVIPDLDIVSIKTSELGSRVFKKNGYNPDIKKNPYMGVMNPVNLNESYLKSLFNFKSSEKTSNPNLSFATTRDYKEALEDSDSDVLKAIKFLTESGFNKKSGTTDSEAIKNVDDRNEKTIDKVKKSKLYQMNILQESLFNFINQELNMDGFFEPIRYEVENTTTPIIPKESFYKDINIFYENMFIFSNNLAGKVGVLDVIKGNYPVPNEFKYIDRESLDKLISNKNFHFTTLSSDKKNEVIFNTNDHYSVLMISEYDEKYEALSSKKKPSNEELDGFKQKDIKFIYSEKIKAIKNISIQNIQKDNEKNKPVDKSAYKTAINQLMWKWMVKGSLGVSVDLPIEDGCEICLEYYETVSAKNKREWVKEEDTKDKMRYIATFEYFEGTILSPGVIKLVSGHQERISDDRNTYTAGLLLLSIAGKDFISIEKKEDFNLLNTYTNIEKMKVSGEIKSALDYFIGRDINSRSYNAKTNYKALKTPTGKRTPFIRRVVFDNGENAYYMPKPQDWGVEEIKQRKFIVYSNFVNPKAIIPTETIDLINSLYIQDVIKLGDNSRSTILEQMLKKYFDI